LLGQDPSAYFSRVLEARRAEVAEWASVLRAYLPNPPARILEAGCGPGLLAVALAEHYHEATVVGVDIEPEAIELARALAATGPKISFRVGSLEAPPSTDRGAFDLIVSRTTLEHVQQPRVVLRRLLESLRPDGALFLETPNYLFPYEPHVRLWMLPKSPKALLSLECRLFRRDPSFIHHLQFACDPISIKRWAQANDDIEVVNLMAAKVERLLAGEESASVTWRQAVIDAVRRRPHLRAGLARAGPHLPIWPSVQLLMIRR
jgi:2-polyprenyl-3-methyl-5-hydroxy-6-metoxy-1,4-benzoquinol methylase